MSSIPGWSALNQTDVSAFLTAANLSSPPEVAELSEAQWTILQGIVGQEGVQKLRTEAGLTHNAAKPRLPAPKLTDYSDLVARMAEADLEMNIIMEKFMTSSVQVNKDKMAKNAEERMKKLEEAHAKLEAANNAKKIPWWKKLLNWIAAIFTAVVGVVLGVVSGGTLGAVGAALAVAAFAMFVLNETGVTEKLAEAIAEGLQKPPFNCSAEFAQKFGKWFTVALDLAVTVASLATSCANAANIAKAAKLVKAADGLKGAVSANKTVTITANTGREAAKLIGQAARIAPNVTAKTSAFAAKTIQTLGVVSGITEGALQIHSGVKEIEAGKLTKEARDKQAEAKELKAFIAKLQSMLSEDTDRIREIIERINDLLNGFSDIIDDIGASHRAVIQNLNA